MELAYTPLLCPLTHQRYLPGLLTPSFLPIATRKYHTLFHPRSCVHPGAHYSLRSTSCLPHLHYHRLLVYSPRSLQNAFQHNTSMRTTLPTPMCRRIGKMGCLTAASRAQDFVGVPLLLVLYPNSFFVLFHILLLVLLLHTDR